MANDKDVTIPLRPHDKEHLIQWNQRNSPLPRLPAEIRNSIYSYLFHDATVRFRYEASQRPYVPLSRKSRRFSALLSTSRQLHYEANPIFLSSVTVYVDQIRQVTDSAAFMDVKACRMITSLHISDPVAVEIDYLTFGHREKEKFMESDLPSLRRVVFGKKDRRWEQNVQLAGCLRSWFGDLDLDVRFDGRRWVNRRRKF